MRSVGTANGVSWIAGSSCGAGLSFVAGLSWVAGCREATGSVSVDGFGLSDESEWVEHPAIIARSRTAKCQMNLKTFVLEEWCLHMPISRWKLSFIKADSVKTEAFILIDLIVKRLPNPSQFYHPTRVVGMLTNFRDDENGRSVCRLAGNWQSKENGLRQEAWRRE